jgi:hypothetical protein
MAAKEELFTRLGREKELLEAETPEMLEEWRTALTQLFRQFAAWLAEPVAANLLQVDESTIEIQEPGLGEYPVQALKVITPKGDAVHIVPKARMVVGNYGRVDFECSPRRLSLLRREPDRWQFARLAPEQGGWSFQDLSESSFWEALQYVLS